jgi:hypothetical protein
MMAGFGLTSIASAQVITDTGPGSLNRIDNKVTNNCSIKNNNKVSANNTNKQTAKSGDASQKGNTNAGSSWGDWSTLDPITAQADGIGHDAWWNNVVDWMAQQAAGNGWDSSGDNLSWAPSGDNWSSFDPMTWQANGQSFGNWWDGAQSFLDRNSGKWLLDWPQGTGDAGNFGRGATSGNATNNNNANFRININNAANACRQNKIVPSPVKINANASASAAAAAAAEAAANQSNIVAAAPSSNVTPGAVSSGVGGVGGGPGRGGAQGPSNIRSANVPIAASRAASSAQASAAAAAAASQQVHVQVPVQRAVIANTGPNSSNVVSSKVENNTSVKNTNDICITNTNTQKASTGDATVSGNTNAGSSDSGNAGNGNGTGAGIDISN